VNIRVRVRIGAWLALVFVLTLARAGPVIGSLTPFGLLDATDVLSATAGQADVGPSTVVKDGAHRTAEHKWSSSPGAVPAAATAFAASLVIALALVAAGRVAMLRGDRCTTRAPPRLA